MNTIYNKNDRIAENIKPKKPNRLLKDINVISNTYKKLDNTLYTHQSNNNQPFEIKIKNMMVID
jgi:hypothetical protein